MLIYGPCMFPPRERSQHLSITYTVVSFLSLLSCTENNVAAIADSALAHICQGVEQLFTSQKVLLNGTFWENIVNKLRLDLINGGLVDSTLYKRSEATVVADLFLPLLKRIAHSASMKLTVSNVDLDALQYYSFLESEIHTETKKHRRGRKPSVDFLMYGAVERMEGEDSAIYIIPVEAKKELSTKHVAQISTTLVLGKYIQDNATVGTLIDDTLHTVCVLVLRDDDRPLPIVLISPPMLWRDSVFLLSQTCVCLQNLKVPRMVVNEQSAEYFGQDRWSDIKAIARQVEREYPFKAFMEKPRALFTAYTDLKADLADMKKEMSALHAWCSSVAQHTPPPCGQRAIVAQQTPLPLSLRAAVKQPLSAPRTKRPRK